MSAVLIFLLFSFLLFKYTRWIISQNEAAITIQSLIFGINYKKETIYKNTVIDVNSRKLPHGIGYWYLSTYILYLQTNKKKYKIVHHRDLKKLKTLQELILSHLKS